MVTICLLLGLKQFLRHFFIIVSCVLCSGMCGNIQEKKVYFYIWFLCVRTVMDMYSGEMASQQISRPEEVTLETTQDLHNANYSAVTQNIMEKFAAKSLFQKLTSTKFGSVVNPDIYFAMKIIDRKIATPKNSDPASYIDVAKIVFTKYRSRLAFFYYWYQLLMLPKSALLTLQSTVLPQSFTLPQLHTDTPLLPVPSLLDPDLPLLTMPHLLINAVLPTIIG